MHDYNRELKITIDIVRKASLITEYFRKKGFQSFIKQDQTPVTLADFASQIFLISELKQNFPEDEIIAEEENFSLIDEKAINQIKECFNELNFDDEVVKKESRGVQSNPSERQWTIDPIDGTKGFQEDLSYAIGVGLMVNSIPEVCTIGVPNYKNKRLALFSAIKGQGAHVTYNRTDFSSLTVSHQENMKDARFCHSLHYDKPWIKKFIEIVGIKNHFQIDSMVKFCMIADGSVDLYLKPLDVGHSFVWDFMPGDLLVREAGGVVTDLNANNLIFKNKECIMTLPGIIASNGILHSPTLEFIKNMIGDIE
jgi:3'(2'), 5'-bisphosphate nucleotidase